MKALTCPRCKSEIVRRSRRQTPGERLASLVRVFPFRCQLCRHRFRAFRPRDRFIRTMERDRREYERVSVEAWSALWRGQHSGEARVIDVSSNGLAIETGAPVREGEIVQLEVLPPGADRPIAVDQAVVRSVRPGRLGVQFIRVQADDEGRLRRHLYEVFVSRLE
jgi:hypothetical protein